MRTLFLFLFGGALLCVGAPACSGLDNAFGGTNPECTPESPTPARIIDDYLAAHDACSFDSDCRLLSHVVVGCTASCALALRSDAVTGFYQALETARHTPCQGCVVEPGGDPYAHYPECAHGKWSAACGETGKCVVKFTKLPSDLVDAAADGDAADTGADSDASPQDANTDAPGE